MVGEYMFTSTASDTLFLSQRLDIRTNKEGHSIPSPQISLLVSLEGRESLLLCSMV
jgi:hypothetical protein